MKPPSDFNGETCSVKLALSKRALGRYSERTAVQVSVHRTVDALHSIWWELESGSIYGCSSVLDSGDVGPGIVMCWHRLSKGWAKLTIGKA